MIRVALPPETRVREVRAEARETERLNTEVLPIAPLQPARPGIAPPSGKPVRYRRGEEQREYNRKQSDPRQDKRFVDPYPVPPFVPPSPELYAEAVQWPTAKLLEMKAED